LLLRRETPPRPEQHPEKRILFYAKPLHFRLHDQKIIGPHREAAGLFLRLPLCHDHTLCEHKTECNRKKQNDCDLLQFAVVVFTMRRNQENAMANNFGGNEPAFPVILPAGGCDEISYGMSRRDYLAAVAMHSMIGPAVRIDPGNELDELQRHAARSYLMADAVIEAGTLSREVLHQRAFGKY
jgi:hypothetical protein